MENKHPASLQIRAVAPDDRILILTRLLAAFVVPVLSAAVFILYLLPGYTGELFAWAIRPNMSAMMLGAAYLGGVYFFTRVVLSKNWHRIHIALLPITAFVVFLGIATILHWDRFTAGHPSFAAWAGLYFTLPVILPLVWWLNRNADPQTLESEDRYLPPHVRQFFLVVGIVLTIVSVILLVVPGLFIPVWAWTLTPLTARVMAAMFVLPGLIAVGIAFDRRWSSARIILQSQILSLAFIVLAVVISRGDFDWTQPVAWLFTLAMGGMCISLSAIYWWMERRPAHH